MKGKRLHVVLRDKKPRKPFQSAFKWIANAISFKCYLFQQFSCSVIKSFLI